jgi:hypothetical protein
MNRTQAVVLRAFAIWTIYVWVTRMWNIWRDTTQDLPFKLVHTTLAVISVAFAIACLVIVRRVRAACLAAGQAAGPSEPSEPSEPGRPASVG